MKVSISLGFSHTPENTFSSYKFNVTVEDDARPGEKIEDTYTRVYNYVKKKVDKELEAIQDEHQA